MDYTPLGTRAFDHFIVEYDRQAKARGWSVQFGFTGEPRGMSVEWFRYNASDCFEAVSVRKPDVVQTSFHSAFDKLILALKFGATRKLAIIDHSSGEGPSPRSWLRIPRQWRGARVGRIVDAVVCVSEYNARRAVERVFLPKEKVHVVPNGIDLARFQERTLPQPLTAEPGRGEKLVYVGQLIRAKGVHTLLEAMVGIDAELLVAGSGPERGELEAFAKSHTLNVTFLGQVADVAALYSEAAVAVVPSEWAEAFGLVAIEAMACGTPVIASDAGALPEVIGDAGVIFRTGDAAELRAKLMALLGNTGERQRLSQAGRQRVEQHYQLHDCVRKHLEIVDSLKCPSSD